MDALSIIAVIGGIALLAGLFGGLTAKDLVIPPLPVQIRILSASLGVLLIAVVVWCLSPAFSGRPVTSQTKTPAQSTGKPGLSTGRQTDSPTDCSPLPFSEWPSQSIAIVKPEKGATTQVPLDTLRYEETSGLKLASGKTIPFKQMKSFNLSNKDFRQHFIADVVITFLDCKTYTDVIKSESGSFLTGQPERGVLELHILEVKRVDFQ